MEHSALSSLACQWFVSAYKYNALKMINPQHEVTPLQFVLIQRTSCELALIHFEGSLRWGFKNFISIGGQLIMQALLKMQESVYTDKVHLIAETVRRCLSQHIRWFELFVLPSAHVNRMGFGIQIDLSKGFTCVLIAAVSGLF